MENTSKNSLTDLLLDLRRRMTEDAKKTCESIGPNKLSYELTLQQLEVLWLIGFSGRKSMESIATHLNVKPPSATSVVDKMMKLGLLMRESDDADRRVVYIDLTQDTKKDLTKIKRQKEALLDNLISRLSAADKKELERIVKILIEK